METLLFFLVVLNVVVFWRIWWQGRRVYRRVTERRSKPLGVLGALFRLMFLLLWPLEVIARGVFQALNFPFYTSDQRLKELEELQMWDELEHQRQEQGSCKDLCVRVRV